MVSVIVMVVLVVVVLVVVVVAAVPAVLVALVVVLVMVVVSVEIYDYFAVVQMSKFLFAGWTTPNWFRSSHHRLGNKSDRHQ